MKRGWLAGVVAALVFTGVPAVGVALSRAADDDQDSAAAAAAEPKETEAAEDADDDGKGSGPPPWAHAGKAKAGSHGPNAGWKAAWRAMTPQQRADTMAKLVKAHDNGMRAWEKCVTAAAADAGARAKCVKPLPPGLAKKQLTVKKP